MTHSRRIQQIADDIEAALSGHDEPGAGHVAASVLRSLRSAASAPRRARQDTDRLDALCSHTLRDQAVLEADMLSAMHDYIAAIRYRALELESRGY
jgi:hypothetical protein